MNGFWKKVLWIGAPVALQNLINTILNMCDTMMVSTLGDDFVSAVGLANKVFFVFNLVLFGICSGSTILASQYYGKGDEKGINKIFGFSLMLSIIAGLLFFISAFFLPKTIMGLFTNNQEYINIGYSYLKIVSISYVMTAISMAITALLKSVNRTRIPMIVTLISVGINIICNYLFIFGKFGFRQMGVDGAALGTVIARIVEVALIVCYLIFSKKDFKLNIKSMFILDKTFIFSALIFILPVFFNELGWGLGTTIYSVIYGHMDDIAVPTMTLAAVIQDLAWVFLLGISNAAAIIIGNSLGANLFDDAKKAAVKLLKANFILGFIMALVVVIMMNPYLLLYPKITDDVKNSVIHVSIVFACFLPFKAFNLTNICGVLRSGGDTIACMMLDICGVWLIAIPLGLLGAFVFNLNIGWVFLMICIEEVVKLFVGFTRYKQMKWVRNVVKF